MNYYKLETTRSIISTPKGKRTYKYFLSSYESMTLRMKNELFNKATVKVKEISESEFTKATTIRD